MKDYKKMIEKQLIDTIDRLNIAECDASFFYKIGDDSKFRKNCGLADAYYITAKELAGMLGLKLVREPAHNEQYDFVFDYFKVAEA